MLKIITFSRDESGKLYPQKPRLYRGVNGASLMKLINRYCYSFPADYPLALTGDGIIDMYTVQRCMRLISVNACSSKQDIGMGFVHAVVYRWCFLLLTFMYWYITAICVYR